MAALSDVHRLCDSVKYVIKCFKQTKKNDKFDSQVKSLHMKNKFVLFRVFKTHLLINQKRLLFITLPEVDTPVYHRS